MASPRYFRRACLATRLFFLFVFPLPLFCQSVTAGLPQVASHVQSLPRAIITHLFLDSLFKRSPQLRLPTSFPAGACCGAPSSFRVVPPSPSFTSPQTRSSQAFLTNVHWCSDQCDVPRSSVWSFTHERPQAGTYFTLVRSRNASLSLCAVSGRESPFRFRHALLSPYSGLRSHSLRPLANDWSFLRRLDTHSIFTASQSGGDSMILRRPSALQMQPSIPSSKPETMNASQGHGRDGTLLFAKPNREKPLSQTWNPPETRAAEVGEHDTAFSSGLAASDGSATDKSFHSHGEPHGGFHFMFPKTGGYVSSNDIRNGSCVIVGDQAFRVLQFQSVKMARAAAYVRARLKNLVTGATIDHNFRSDEKLQIPEITVVEATFTGIRSGSGGSAGKKGGSKQKNTESAIMDEALRAAGMDKTGDLRSRDMTLVFMNKETWDELLVTNRDVVERITGFLKEGMDVRFGLWEEKVVDIALPATETYTVTEISGKSEHSRGNPGRKQAILETGARVSVPHFVEAGDRIVVRTSNGDFVRRGS